MRLRAVDLALIAALGAALYLPGLGASRSLWNPDEPRFAEIARVMRVHGDWLTPHLNGEPYSNKPVLLFWSILAASRWTGQVDELAARLPSALAAIGVLLLTAIMGARIGGRRTAWLSAVVLATSMRFAWQARWCQTDMLLTLWIALALAAYQGAVRSGGLSTPGALALYGGAALAMLTKGLVGPVLAGLAIGADVLRRRAFREVLRYRLLPGALVFLALAAPWFIAVGAANGSEFLGQFFLRQHLQRFLHPFDHAHGPLYYLYIFPAEFLPWSVVLPGVFLVLARDTTLRQRLAYPLGWFAVTLVLFSISGAKRGQYLLPAYPAAALIVGATLERWLDQKRIGHFPYLWFDVPLWGVPAVIAAGALLAPLVLLFVSRSEAGVGASAALVLVPVCGALALWGVKGARERLLATCASMATLLLVATAIAMPHLEEYKSAKPLAAKIDGVLGHEVPLALYRYDRAHFNFYMQRDVIPSLATLDEGLAFLRAAPRACLLAELRHLAEVDLALGAPLTRVAADSVGHRKLELACTGAWPVSER